MYFARIPKTRVSMSARSSDLEIFVFEADPNWLVVTVLFSNTDIKNHACGSTVDCTDGREGEIWTETYLDGGKMIMHGEPK
jgi:hypothetical protein